MRIFGGVNVNWTIAKSEVRLTSVFQGVSLSYLPAEIGLSKGRAGGLGT